MLVACTAPLFVLHRGVDSCCCWRCSVLVVAVVVAPLVLVAVVRAVVVIVAALVVLLVTVMLTLLHFELPRLLLLFASMLSLVLVLGISQE